ncbi:uncharacterized protein JCM6883_005408 [Sporobolomyces salmoneus]|uniref:uncharacterized protein n=1 Tax=Sporobolomyces salmoneus TaxID=183962 RepID=UPI003177043A
MSTPHSQPGTFKRIVRALSRPDLRSESKKVTRSKSNVTLRSSYYSDDDENRIPSVPNPKLFPAHSYFPPPPEDVLLDGEANGTARHIDSLSADDQDTPERINFAPGVPFAPRRPEDERSIRPESELESWNLPRKQQSRPLLRTRSSKSSHKSTTRSRDGHDDSNNNNGRSYDSSGGDPVRRVDSGSNYSTKSTKSTLGQTAKTLKRAISKTFEPIAKEEGEKRVLVLVADGTEELSLMTAFDIFSRASLSPVLVSVSPEFSPSRSLPSGKLVCCIGAGFLAAKTARIGLGGQIACHSSIRSELEKGYELSHGEVVVSENLITSRGAGTVIEWALTIVEILAGFERRDEVAQDLDL